MKKHFKTFLALLCVTACLFTCMIALASCGEECKHTNTGAIAEAQEPTGPIAGVTAGLQCLDCGAVLEESTEFYRVTYMYRYCVREKNDNDRWGDAEYKEVLGTADFPVGNTGFTEEQIAEVKALTYRGFSFANWYSKWDKDEKKANTDFDFTAPVESNATVYLDRGNLAGKTATWELVELADSTKDKPKYELKINGTGEMFDALSFAEVDIPWYNDINNIVKLTIADGITNVGAYTVHAYNTETNSSTSMLEEIDLPDSIKKIGNSAFVGAKFKTFVAPPNLEVIDMNAFKATKLTSVYLNEGLTTIEAAAFFMSASIKFVVVPTTLKSVGNAAFFPGYSGSTPSAHSLSKVYYLGSDISGFEAIDVAMDNMWFDEIPVVFCYTEDSAKGEEGAYWRYADAAKTMPLQYAFSIRYFDGIHKAPFATDYIRINTVDENNDGLPDVDPTTEDVIMSAAITQENVDFRDNLRYHGFKFKSFSNDIKLGDNITADRSLTGSRGDILSDDGNITWKYTGGTVTISIADQSKCKSIWDFEVPQDTTGLWAGKVADLDNVKSVVLPEGLEYIGSYTFNTMINLTEVYIPTSVKEIHPTAFDGCTNLVNVYYMGENIADCKNIDKLENVNYMTFGKVTAATAEDGDYWMEIGDKRIGWSLHDGALIIAGDSQMMDFTAPMDAPWFGAKEKITSVALARNITTVGANIANAYPNVADIKLNSNLTKIPSSAFLGTPILNDKTKYKDNMLVIDGNLLRVDTRKCFGVFECTMEIKNIAGGAFNGANDVTAIYLSRSVTYIDATVLDGSKIENIYVEGRPGTWNTIAKAFKDTEAAKTVGVYFRSNDVPTDSANRYFFINDAGEYVIHNFYLDDKGNKVPY